MSKRIYGIDLLRICSMIGVIVLHIMGHGNVLETTDSSFGFSVAWLIEIIAYPAVNCFVLISGFVGYRDSDYYPKIKNILSLLFTVLFYSVIICLVFKFVIPDMIGKKDLVKSCFPVLTKQYWFFSTYIMMLLVSPMLNLFVHKANTKMLTITFLLIISFTMLSMISLINFDGGYSFLWFSMLYLLGAIVKKQELYKTISVFKTLCLIVGSVLITWGTKILLHFTGFKFSIINEGMFISYCSITMLMYALGLLLLCSKINVRNTTKSIVRFLTPTAFSVYLIHDNNYVRATLMKDSFIFVNKFNEVSMFFIVLGFALSIFVICSLIDRLRIILFKVFNIDRLAEKGDCLITTQCSELLSRNRLF